MASVYPQSFRLIQPLHFCSKCCIKTAQMCLIGLLIHFQVHNCALSSNNSMVLVHCNSYCKLDSAVRWTRSLAFCPYQICLCPGKSSCYLQPHANHVSSTILWTEHRSRRSFKRICREEWDKLPKYRWAKLVESYPRRLEAVITAKVASA